MQTIAPFGVDALSRGESLSRLTLPHHDLMSFPHTTGAPEEFDAWFITFVLSVLGLALLGFLVLTALDFLRNRSRWTPPDSPDDLHRH